MKTVCSTALLTVLLLNAGAFASDNRPYLKARMVEANVTVMTKNQTWPLRTSMTLEPCSLASCTGV